MRAFCHVDHGTVPDVADVRLRVDRKRSLLPGIQLPRTHCNEGAFGSPVVRKWIGEIASVTFAPKAILHPVNPLHERIPVELLRKKIV